MTSFRELTEPDPRISAQLQQERADAVFPEIARSSGYSMWQPGDSIPQRGRRVMIGVATYSPSDMELLDLITPAVERDDANDLRVDLFNARDVRSPEAFDQFIPGIGSVLQTPVAGLWQDGQLVEKAQGSRARLLVRQWLTNLPARV